MNTDYLVEAAHKAMATIVTAYRDFEDKRPIIMLDIQEHKVYAYPYKEFKEGLSKKDRIDLAKEYRQAKNEDKIVVFVRDNEKRKLVSFLVEKPTFEVVEL